MLSHARVRAFHEWKVKQLAFREYTRRENLRRYNRQRGFIINPYAFGTAPTDPNFANVVSLAHFDGTNGDTGPFADQIANRSPGWTRNAVGAQLSTATVKYGTASVNCGTVGMYNADHADWGFGSDWTLEGWFNAAATNNGSGNFQVLVTKGWDAGIFPPWLLYLGTDQSINFAGSTGGTAFDYVVLSAASQWSINTWYHFAAVGSGTSFYGFLSGAAFAATGSASGALTTNASNVTLGSNLTPGGTSYALNGFIDDFRATKGVARYTAGFTPPATAFPDS